MHIGRAMAAALRSRAVCPGRKCRHDQAEHRRAPLYEGDTAVFGVDVSSLREPPYMVRCLRCERSCFVSVDAPSGFEGWP